MAKKKKRRSPMRRRYRHVCWMIDTLIRKKDCKMCGDALWSPGWWKQSPPTVTVHHLNGKHHDDNPKNHALVHSRCHRAYHMREGHKAGRFSK